MESNEDEEFQFCNRGQLFGSKTDTRVEQAVDKLCNRGKSLGSEMLRSFASVGESFVIVANYLVPKQFLVVTEVAACFATVAIYSVAKCSVRGRSCETRFATVTIYPVPKPSSFLDESVGFCNRDNLSGSKTSCGIGTARCPFCNRDNLSGSKTDRPVFCALPAVLWIPGDVKPRLFRSFTTCSRSFSNDFSETFLRL